MPLLYEYRIRCVTENLDRFIWLADTDPSPTTCPVNTAHAVALASVAVVEQLGSQDVEVGLKIGGPKTDIDGVSLSAIATEQKRAEYSMPEALHLQGVLLTWTGCQPGDYGWIAVIHPSGDAALAIAANAGLASVTLPTGLGAVYTAAAYMEFWEPDNSKIREVRKIASVANDVVTLASNLAQTHAIGINIRARVDGFSPVRGANGIDGGLRLLNSGRMLIENQNGMTALISAGLLLSARLIASSVVGARELAVNYRFRKPMA